MDTTRPGATAGPFGGPHIPDGPPDLRGGDEPLPFVKDAMKAAFPTDMANPADPYVVALAKAAQETADELKGIRATKLPAAKRELADAIAAKTAEAAGGSKQATKAAGKVLAKAKTKVRELEDQMRVLDPANAAAESVRMREHELPTALKGFGDAAAAAAEGADPSTQRLLVRPSGAAEGGDIALEARRG